MAADCGGLLKKVGPLVRIAIHSKVEAPGTRGGTALLEAISRNYPLRGSGSIQMAANHLPLTKVNPMLRARLISVLALFIALALEFDSSSPKTAFFEDRP